MSDSGEDVSFSVMQSNMWTSRGDLRRHVTRLARLWGFFLSFLLSDGSPFVEDVTDVLVGLTVDTPKAEGLKVGIKLNPISYSMSLTVCNELELL